MEEGEKEKEKKLTSINLLNPRQCQLNLDSVPRGGLPHERVPLKVNGDQFLQPAQLLSNLLERGELVIAGPQLLEVGQVREVGEVGDLVIRDVQDAQVFVGLEACDGG